MSISDQVRPGIRAISGYIPGEQPRPGERIIKLNTNENPYPPPEPVLAALRKAIEDGHALRRYPEPTSRPVREAAARAYGLGADQVIVGNGSDDILTIILRTFIDPGQGVVAPDPTYSLYRTLTALQGGCYQTVPWGPEGRLPVEALVATGAGVVFVVRPNAPTGHAVALDEVRTLCRAFPGIVVLDEAYGDFCQDHGLPLLAEFDNLIITRSFSKSFSLAGLRIGLGFSSQEITTEMHKVRDSYNLDMLAQAGATAVLDNLEAYTPLIERIRAQRERTRRDLNERGFQTPPGEANFLLTTVPKGRRQAADWLADLKARGILVRHFSHPDLVDKLRISIGSAEEMDALFQAIDLILADN